MLTIQCRRNPIRPLVDRFNCRNDPSTFYSVIHPRHNGSIPPNNFTSIQGMRVRNHCLLLLHEVMGLLMLMTLGSSLRSHPAPIATPIPILSHAVTTTRTTSFTGVTHLRAVLHLILVTVHCRSCNFVMKSLNSSDTRFNHCTFCLLQKLTHIPISQCVLVSHTTTPLPTIASA